MPRFLLITVLLGALVSCETSNEPQKRKPVPPDSGLNSQAWNRQQKWEGSSRFGSMMPQSR